MFMLIQSEVSCKWVDDSQRFLLEHFDAIQGSPSHIYHSALPLCPTSSWLYYHYNTELLQEVKVVKGIPAGWGKCSRTVSLGSTPRVHTSWKDLVVASLYSNDIITINATTGVHLSIISGHTVMVESLSFSPDGLFLISGDEAGTIKLWDIQTGGIIKTLSGHSKGVTCVSISPDHTMIASGSGDNTIHLWNTWTGECFCVIDEHIDTVNTVNFSPTNSKHLMTASADGTVQQWDVDGHRIGPAYGGTHAIFSPDGSHFASWVFRGSVVIIQNLGTGAVIAKLQIPGEDCFCCQFSPDGKSVAVGDEKFIYIWDITSSDPHLIGTFIGHTGPVTSITFSSSLVSSSDDGSIKLWQFNASLVDPVAIGLGSTPLVLVPIRSVNLQTKDDIAISVDSAGVVRRWDLSVGLCTASFQIPAKYLTMTGWVDMQWNAYGWIFVWHKDQCLYIWSTENGGLPQVVDAPWKSCVLTPKISGDGSKVFLLVDKHIHAWSIQTGEVVGEVGFEGELGLEGEPGLEGGEWQCCNPLVVDGSRVWVHFKDSQTQGWDFGISGSAPVPLLNMTSDSPGLELSIKQEGTNQFRIKDTVTGKDVFQLSGRYAMPADVEWDGQYLVAGYGSGEVVILDFDHIPPYHKHAVCWPSSGCKGWSAY